MIHRYLQCHSLLIVRLFSALIMKDGWYERKNTSMKFN